MLANASKSERILYSSTDGLDGKTPIAVSGALFWPKGDAPAGGWPLVAWAHGTVGATAVCAPSFAGRSERDKTYLNAWLARAFAVVATDYQGLGTAGGHPYLATRPEAYGVLDAVRARATNRERSATASVLVGQSQGAGAAFATAAFQPDYAPGREGAGNGGDRGCRISRKQTLAAILRGGPSDKVTPTLGLLLPVAATGGTDHARFRSRALSDRKWRAAYAMGDVACLGAMEDGIEKAGVSAKVRLRPDRPRRSYRSLFPLIAYPTVASRRSRCSWARARRITTCRRRCRARWCMTPARRGRA